MGIVLLQGRIVIYWQNTFFRNEPLRAIPRGSCCLVAEVMVLLFTDVNKCYWVQNCNNGAYVIQFVTVINYYIYYFS